MGRDIWFSRLKNGKITDSGGTPIGPDTPYRPGLELLYYREVDIETPIPFRENILFQNDHLLVADKPHFLPVTPSGSWVNECLLYRLKKSTGLDYLVPLHRLDRETAGLVIFAANRDTSGLYGDLFDNRKIRKTYEAIGVLPLDKTRSKWSVSNRIVPGKHWLLMETVEGEPNASTDIRLLEAESEQGRFELVPHTGRTHQLRLHMLSIGSRIINDRFYPALLPEAKDRFDAPLQLLARYVSFVDPVSGEPCEFESDHRLSL